MCAVMPHPYKPLDLTFICRTLHYRNWRAYGPPLYFFFMACTENTVPYIYFYFLLLCLFLILKI